MIVNKKYRSEVCLNCNHPLDISDKYCCNCGQLNSKKRLSLKDFINEFLANFYAYDSRVKRTIVDLFLNPGKPSLEFINGKRQTYANPFRFYLSVSIVFFIIQGLITKYEIIDNPNIRDSVRKNEVLKIETGENVDENDSIEKPSKIYTEKELSQFGFYTSFKHKFNSFTEFYRQNPDLSIKASLDSMQYSQTKMNQYIYKKGIDSVGMFYDGNNDNEFEDYIFSKLPFIFFMSLPFLTLAFSFVYIRRRLNYAEHLVFVFSTMSFVFLILLIDEILSFAFNLSVKPLLAAGLFFYFYKSLRNFYKQSRVKTMIKFVILKFILIILSTIAVLFVAGIAFLTY